MAKVYLVEWQGCECGGLEPVAFSARELAEQWVFDNTRPFISDTLRRPKETAIDSYEVIEAELV